MTNLFVRQDLLSHHNHTPSNLSASRSLRPILTPPLQSMQFNQISEGAEPGFATIPTQYGELTDLTSAFRMQQTYVTGEIPTCDRIRPAITETLLLADCCFYLTHNSLRLHHCKQRAWAFHKTYRYILFS